jgi:large subunit ribosomal protein L19e
MSVRSQRRVAASILKVGQNRIWLDPEDMDAIGSAITRTEIRKLIHEGAIRTLPESGSSKGRARAVKSKKRAGRRSGSGSRKGPSLSRKTAWILRIRAIRYRLRELRDKRMIQTATYRKLSLMAKGGSFRSASHLDEYIETHKLVRKR